MTDRYKLAYRAIRLEDENNMQFAAIVMSALAASSLLFLLLGVTDSALGLALLMLFPATYLFVNRRKYD